MEGFDLRRGLLKTESGRQYFSSFQKKSHEKMKRPNSNKVFVKLSVLFDFPEHRSFLPMTFFKTITKIQTSILEERLRHWLLLFLLTGTLFIGLIHILFF